VIVTATVAGGVRIDGAHRLAALVGDRGRIRARSTDRDRRRQDDEQWHPCRHARRVSNGPSGSVRAMAILSDAEIRAAIAGRRAWRRDGDSLVRERALRDFGEALAFLDRIGRAVDDYGRHPDIAIIGGNRVRVIVSNGNGAGLTDAELRLVAKVDEVADAPAPDPERPRGPLAAVAASAASTVQTVSSTAVEAVEEPAEAVIERTGRGAVVAAVAGGVALGAATVLAARRR
jgi:pterin-4a-carbinolamine dehydratase